MPPDDHTDQAEADKIRIDKWLWATRCYKTRSRAADACKGSAVRIAGRPVKASTMIQVGDIVTVRNRELLRTIRVRAITEKRLGAARVAEYLEDITPQAELDAARERRENARLYKGSGGRPTKRDRREMERLIGPEAHEE